MSVNLEETKISLNIYYRNYPESDKFVSAIVRNNTRYFVFKSKNGIELYTLQKAKEQKIHELIEYFEGLICFTEESKTKIKLRKK